MPKSNIKKNWFIFQNIILIKKIHPVAKANLHLKETIASTARSHGRSFCDSSRNQGTVTGFEDIEEYHKDGSELSDGAEYVVNSNDDDSDVVIYCSINSTIICNVLF